LIPASAPLVEDIASFWHAHYFNASEPSGGAS
jgi:hypothetical protein